MLLTILSFLIILTILVLVHEVGHFLTAKFFGVKVEEFGFGFPPKAWGKKIGETVYSLNWLPIGGFVKLYGEDMAGGGKISLKMQDETKQKGDKALREAFIFRPIYQRFTIIFAGVFMNFLLAVALLTYLVIVQGIPTQGNKVFIQQIANNSPAQKAQLRVGDRILAVDNLPISSPSQLIAYTKSHLGKLVTLRIQDTSSHEHVIAIVPRVHYPSREGAMGVAVAANVVVRTYPWYIAPFIGVKEAVQQSWMIFVGLYQLLVQLISKGQVPQELAGPVGIAQLTGQFVQLGINPVLSLVALLSLNLAILNILPIPALDGGRLFFILIELVTRRKVSPKIEGYAHTVGMVLLLTLVVFITFHDIFRIMSGQSILPK